MNTSSLLLALAAASALLAAAPAQADVYTFDFVSLDGGLSAVGDVDVVGGQAVGMSGQVTGAGASYGWIGTQEITGVVANPNAPGVSTSSDGAWLYDNLVSRVGIRVDLDGLLFTTAQNPGGFWNFYTTGPDAGDWWLGATVNGSYAMPGYASQGVMVSGSLGAVPEASTWLMMLAGFFFIGYQGVGRTRGKRIEV